MVLRRLEKKEEKAEKAESTNSSSTTSIPMNSSDVDISEMPKKQLVALVKKIQTRLNKL